MSGFFAELGIDMDEQEAAGFQEAEPGFYAFETGPLTLVNGTSKDESIVKAKITYHLFNDDGTPAGSKDEWWTLFENYDEVTAKAEKSRGYLKTRLQTTFGIEKSLNEIQPEDTEGLRGTCSIVQNGEYTNIRQIKVDKAETAAAPVAKARAAAAPKAAGQKPNPFKK